MAKSARCRRYEMFGIFKGFVAMHPSVALVGSVKSQVHWSYAPCWVAYIVVGIFWLTMYPICGGLYRLLWTQRRT